MVRVGELMQAYEGYFENGQFYTLGQTMHIKGRRRAIITILDDPAELAKSEKQETKSETDHAKAWREFFEASNASDESIPEIFEKINFKRETEI